MSFVVLLLSEQNRLFTVRLLREYSQSRIKWIKGSELQGRCDVKPLEKGGFFSVISGYLYQKANFGSQVA